MTGKKRRKYKRKEEKKQEEEEKEETFIKCLLCVKDKVNPFIYIIYPYEGHIYSLMITDEKTEVQRSYLTYSNVHRYHMSTIILDSGWKISRERLIVDNEFTEVQKNTLGPCMFGV